MSITINKHKKIVEVLNSISLSDEEIQTIDKSIDSIIKVLNREYYNSDNEIHYFISGSYGRKTAIKGSDIDLLYILPDDKEWEINRKTYNGQSSLLQEIKDILLVRYPNTEIKGDGQVVVINFYKYKIEVVPCFYNGYSFKYPDTHKGEVGNFVILKMKSML